TTTQAPSTSTSTDTATVTATTASLSVTTTTVTGEFSLACLSRTAKDARKASHELEAMSSFPSSSTYDTLRVVLCSYALDHLQNEAGVEHRLIKL
ncbi:hypothetical protein LTR33_017358, partial [Friedmanniomyces endolithicus]